MEAAAQYATWYNVAYLITGILFILGLKYMSSPRTARFGNRLSMAGMVIALGATFAQGVVQWPVIIGGLIVGAAVGIYFGRAVKMTAMPQMVAIFNGCGGGAASLVGDGRTDEDALRGKRQSVAGRLHVYDDAHRRDRRAQLLRLDHRVPQAARTDDRPSDHLSGPASHKRAGAARDPLRGVHGDRQRPRRPAAFRHRTDTRARARRTLRAADRRRGYAGRDLAAQLVHGPGRGIDRVRPQQQRADHRRRAGRRVAERCSRF